MIEILSKIIENFKYIFFVFLIYQSNPSYHGSEVCELLGLFILNELIIDKKIYKSNCCLYRDDGLPIFKKRSPRIIDQLRKSITKSFQKHNLKVKIEISTPRVDF